MHKENKENMFNVLSKIEKMYPSSIHTLDFFKKNANYFKLHNFKGQVFSKRADDKTPSVHSGKNLKSIDFGGEAEQLSIIQFIADIENQKLIEEFGFQKASLMDDYMTFQDCHRLKENKLLIRELGYKKAFASGKLHQFNEEEKRMHKRRINSYKRAIEILKNLVGWTTDMNLNTEVYVPSVQEKVMKKSYSERYIARMQRALNLPSNIQIKEQLISGLFRTCSKEEILIGIDKFSIGLNTYEVESKEESGKFEEIKRLFITERDYDGIPHGSFRYNRLLSPKGLIRGSSKRVLLGEHLIKLFNKSTPIVFSEGHSDVVVNTAKGIQCLTSGSSTTKIGDSISHLKGFTLHFFPDSDEAGFKGAVMKILEVENFNRTIESEEDKIKFKVKPWSLNIEKYYNDEGVEFGGVFNFEDRLQWIHKEFEKDTFENLTIEEAISISDPNLWEPLKSSPVKKGFDFIDFHERLQSSDISDIAKQKMNKLLNNYKV